MVKTQKLAEGLVDGSVFSFCKLDCWWGRGIIPHHSYFGYHIQNGQDIKNKGVYPSTPFFQAEEVPRERNVSSLITLRATENFKAKFSRAIAIGTDASGGPKTAKDSLVRVGASVASISPLNPDGKRDVAITWVNVAGQQTVNRGEGWALYAALTLRQKLHAMRPNPSGVLAGLTPGRSGLPLVAVDSKFALGLTAPALPEHLRFSNPNCDLYDIFRSTEQQIGH